MKPVHGLTEISPNVCSARRFFFVSFANIPSQFGFGKLSTETTKSMMVDCLGGNYRLYISKTGLVLNLKDIRMIEDIPYYED